jgi:AraC-like DNA-binding protein
MEYVARWRMLLAADKLENSRDSVSAIALSLGYESESAFSAAFKRVMRCSPRQYSRAARRASCPQTRDLLPAASAPTLVGPALGT